MPGIDYQETRGVLLDAHDGEQASVWYENLTAAAEKKPTHFSAADLGDYEQKLSHFRRVENVGWVMVQFGDSDWESLYAMLCTLDIKRGQQSSALYLFKNIPTICCTECLLLSNSVVTRESTPARFANGDNQDLMAFGFAVRHGSSAAVNFTYYAAEDDRSARTWVAAIEQAASTNVPALEPDDEEAKPAGEIGSETRIKAQLDDYLNNRKVLETERQLGEALVELKLPTSRRMVSMGAVNIKAASGVVTVIVDVLEGRKLAARDSGGYSDPYVRVSTFGQSQRTRHLPKRSSAVWGHSFRFTKHITEDESLQAKILLQVYDHNRVLSDKLIGIAQYDLAVVYGTKSHEIRGDWQPVFDPSGS